MKLLRYGPVGQEKPGLLDSDGVLRDLSGELPDFTPEQLSSERLRQLSRLDPAALPEVAGRPRLGVPVAGIRKFIAVGLNYADHAAEAGLPVPKEPVLFTKAISCLSGPNDDVMIPKGSKKTDWEVELAIVIGTRASYVRESEALAHVAGFCVCNDVSEREFQLERSGQWVKGKSAPTFGPLGPWLVTPDEIKDVQALGMWLDVNGERMQTGSTKTMVFGVKTLISYISQFMILEPGDVITTGTPPGVGAGMKPPRFLKAGDTMTLGVDGLGQQTQHVVAWKAG